MSDKLKDAVTPIVDVVTGGAKVAAVAPVVVETGSDAVEVLVEVIDKNALNKRFVIGVAAALAAASIAGGVIYWKKRRKTTAVEVEELAEEVAHKVVDEMTKPTTK